MFVVSASPWSQLAALIYVSRSVVPTLWINGNSELYKRSSNNFNNKVHCYTNTATAIAESIIWLTKFIIVLNCTRGLWFPLVKCFSTVTYEQIPHISMPHHNNQCWITKDFRSATYTTNESQHSVIRRVAISPHFRHCVEHGFINNGSF